MQMAHWNVTHCGGAHGMLYAALALYALLLWLIILRSMANIIM